MTARILKEVREGADDEGEVDRELGEVFVDGENFWRSFRRFEGARCQFGGGVNAPREGAEIDSRTGKEIADKPVDGGDLVIDGVEVGRCRRGIGLAGELGVQANSGERRANLVGYRREEGALVGDLALDAGRHVVEGLRDHEGLAVAGMHVRDADGKVTATEGIGGAEERSERACQAAREHAGGAPEGQKRNPDGEPGRAVPFPVLEDGAEPMENEGRDRDRPAEAEKERLPQVPRDVAGNRKLPRPTSMNSFEIGRLTVGMPTPASGSHR